jgi:hypothetical protein
MSIKVYSLSGRGLNCVAYCVVAAENRDDALEMATKVCLQFPLGYLAINARILPLTYNGAPKVLDHFESETGKIIETIQKSQI